MGSGRGDDEDAGLAQTLAAPPASNPAIPVSVPVRSMVSASGEYIPQREDTPPLPPNFQPPTFEGYVVLDQVGEGGMGVVFAAYDPKLDRKVALKLLHSRGQQGEDSGAATQRLLREAQAMAKLSHPNVVSVYQVGMHGGAIFIAMEFVDGATLTDWLKPGTHGWQDTLAVLVKAGRGLEAAHAAGLVHRDFKPDNVLIGRDGRVRVSDFGLARVQAAPAPEPSAEAGREASRDVASHSSVGGLAGTPRYMAPEQHHLARIEARADQFSFCVTLYEALFRQRPFDGNTYAELAFNVTQGSLRPMPAMPKVPRAVRNALLRGLSTDPEQRFPTMTALLDVLDRKPVSRRNIAIACVGVVGLAVGTASFVTRDNSSAAATCADPSDKLATIWNDAKRATIASAFAATKLPYAELARSSVFDVLDRRSKDWIAMHRDACVATRVRGDQSEALLDRRMLCLERQRTELAELVELLAKGGPDIVRNATVTARRLTPLDTCADAEALMSDTALPTDPVARAELAAIQREVARGRLMLNAARFADGLTIARTAVERASKMSYPPIEAEALLLDGQLENQIGELAKAEALLTRAAERADIGRDDRVKATALVELVYLLGHSMGESAKADIVSQLASSALARVGNLRELEALLARNTGALRFVEGRYDEARTLFEHCLALRRTLFGENHPDVATALDHLGTATLRLGKPDEALAFHARAVEILERVLGAEHPSTAQAINNLGTAYASQNNLDEAERLYRKALELWQRTLGDKHSEIAVARANLGALALARGDHAAAIAEFGKALEIERAALGPNHPTVAETLADLGHAEIARDKPERAIEPLTEAVRIWEASTHVSHEGQVARFALAETLWRTGGNKQRALTLAREAHAALLAEGPNAKETADEVAAWLDERQDLR